MESNVRDKDIAVVVDGEPVGHGEGVLAEGVHDVAVVRVQGDDDILVDLGLAGQGLVLLKGPSKKT